jgi:hypothetical protein
MLVNYLEQSTKEPKKARYRECGVTLSSPSIERCRRKLWKKERCRNTLQHHRSIATRSSLEHLMPHSLTTLRRVEALKDTWFSCLAWLLTRSQHFNALWRNRQLRQSYLLYHLLDQRWRSGADSLTESSWSLTRHLLFCHGLESLLPQHAVVPHLEWGDTAHPALALFTVTYLHILFVALYSITIV